jgi:hypothetical protein
MEGGTLERREILLLQRLQMGTLPSVGWGLEEVAVLLHSRNHWHFCFLDMGISLEGVYRFYRRSFHL